MDLATYSEYAQHGPCFICRLVDGDPAYAHEIVYEDEQHLAFLDKWPVLPGKLLVVPKRHLEHVVTDLTEQEYLAIMRTVRLVALAAEDVLAGERTYLFSLGSQSGNSHLHWHIARLPHGVPYERQQFDALAFENGVLAYTEAERTDLAERLRRAVMARVGENN
ncbi:HIT family protein [Kitasatospora viridis]|uniref:Histidine triad (HIT) family protein/ATP adenylyltransferase n=2 Tax=Kitasatospora viridis TaxID=281105 RepID=A0A561SFD6_9ACTN|nr:histidine triad (HIT) family protein/ATP adenylyltransferase [Kitasatospora viridis]